MSVRLLSPEEPLHQVARDVGGLAVMTYNVLLPSPGDEGWVRKAYDHAVPAPARALSHRQGLLRAQLLGARPDVLCLQETRGPTFDEDFRFLREAGYDRRLHRTARIMPATAFLAEHFTCVGERSTDRALTVILQPHVAPDLRLAVVNVHLSAAADPRPRFRQLLGALERLTKDLDRRGVEPAHRRVLVCGDFNAPPDGSATDHYLRGGTVGADFREPTAPDRMLSSRDRRHGFGPLHDVVRDALGRPPVTLVGSRLTAYTPTAQGLPPALVDALDALFDRFSSDRHVLAWPEVEAWLTAINGAPDRGPEWRRATALVADHPERALSREAFHQLIEAEIAAGRYWSVQHDLQALGLATDPDRHLFAASLDRIYASAGLEPLGVREPLSRALVQELTTGQLGLPSASHPSDHVPLGAVLGLRP